MPSGASTSWRDRASRIAALAAVFAGFGAYHLLNVRRDPLHVMALPLDWLIPLVPAFSIPYLLYLPYLFFTAAYGILATDQWKRVTASFLVAQIAACVAYVAYQTHVPRPAVPDDALFGNLLRFIYSYDQPYNTFPSLHAAHSLISLYWWRRMNVRWFRAAAALTALILLSTVLLKQHVLLDVSAGAALAAAAIIAAEKMFPLRPTTRA
ncbi:MAG: hypothetical protein RL272_548 [Candidatus Parcubacteria bacterium]|jgi:membrane-associated phospholipid phosphatase